MSQVANLGIIAFDNFKDCCQLVNKHIKAMRNSNENYLIEIDQIRFNNGEGKVNITETVRGKDIYILSDTSNYSCNYEMHGQRSFMGPDEHFQDIKRVLSAISGKARRITVIMPLLYSSRQHKRQSRESLDCAMALQELEKMGVNTILSYDVHDPTVQNAIPLTSFENLHSSYDIMSELLKDELIMDDIKNKDSTNTIIISPDTGGIDRCVYYASVLGMDLGLFYKRRDYKKIVNGRNPIAAHEYMGREIKGQNIIIIDDIISSGDSVIDVMEELKRKGANKIIAICTFALFTDGIKRFNEMHEKGILHKLYSTNLCYVKDEVKNAPWFKEVDMTRNIASIIDYLNYDKSISKLLNMTPQIQ